MDWLMEEVVAYIVVPVLFGLAIFSFAMALVEGEEEYAREQQKQIQQCVSDGNKWIEGRCYVVPKPSPTASPR
jgi:hypothetical protein